MDGPPAARGRGRNTVPFALNLRRQSHVLHGIESTINTCKSNQHANRINYWVGGKFLREPLITCNRISLLHSGLGPRSARPTSHGHAALPRRVALPGLCREAHHGRAASAYYSRAEPAVKSQALGGVYCSLHVYVGLELNLIVCFTMCSVVHQGYTGSLGKSTNPPVQRLRLATISCHRGRAGM